jgi:transcriptional regulator with XRE-family HTH domain
MARPYKGSPGLVTQLREVIEASGMSLNRISTVSGIGRDRLSRFMRGERDLTLSAAESICKALGWGLAPLAPASEKQASTRRGRRRVDESE